MLSGKVTSISVSTFHLPRAIEVASQLALVVKKPSANAGDARDEGSIPGSGRVPGGGNGNPLQYFYWEIPRTEEPGGPQPMGPQRVRHHWATEHQGCRKRRYNFPSARRPKRLKATSAAAALSPGTGIFPFVSWPENPLSRQPSSLPPLSSSHK